MSDSSTSPASEPSPSEHEAAHEHTPQRDEVADSETEARSLHQMKRFWALIVAIVLLAVVMIQSSSGGASGLMQRLTGGDQPEQPTQQPPAEPAAQKGPLAMSDMDNHPDLVHQPYTAGSIMSGGDDNANSSVELINQFRDLLQVYTWRQAEDDNFTIRVVDDRTGEILEIYEMEEAREEYQKTGEADWLGSIDNERRRITRQLVQKYVDKGYPREPILVKWGRANQVQEGQKLNEPFIEYAIRLSRYLNLSLLVTQIGLVETFNHDKWVSSVGARSRYQMMPYILDQNDLNQYTLRTAAGNTVRVHEEWHPLLTMEPAFKLVRGYVNAVGHEIPGISAYHTGPGNIYKVYRNYLRQNREQVDASTTVMDAYMWATTEGYPYMSKNSSFGPFSRGYVAAAYGALQAVDDTPIDTSKTMLATRVQLKPGATVQLSELINTLQQGQGPRFQTARDVEPAPAVNTGTQQAEADADEMPKSLYNQFRQLNKHIPLPAVPDSVGVPRRGDIQLVSSAQGNDVRFFLPLGAPKALREAGLNVLDPEETFRFDHNTYARTEGDHTRADRRYDALIDRIFHFGFTEENKRRLDQLVDRFKQLAEERPTRYRRDQLEIIRAHQRLWKFGAWDQVNKMVRTVFDDLPSAASGPPSTSASPPQPAAAPTP